MDGLGRFVPNRPTVGMVGGLRDDRVETLVEGALSPVDRIGQHQGSEALGHRTDLEGRLAIDGRSVRSGHTDTNLGLACVAVLAGIRCGSAQARWQRGAQLEGEVGRTRRVRGAVRVVEEVGDDCLAACPGEGQGLEGAVGGLRHLDEVAGR